MPAVGFYCATTVKITRLKIVWLIFGIQICQILVGLAKVHCMRIDRENQCTSERLIILMQNWLTLIFFYFSIDNKIAI